MTMTLIPSHGRDYTSKAKVLADWNSGKDFTIADMSSPDDGRYINLAFCHIEVWEGELRVIVHVDGEQEPVIVTVGNVKN